MLLANLEENDIFSFLTTIILESLAISDSLTKLLNALIFNTDEYLCGNTHWAYSDEAERKDKTYTVFILLFRLKNYSAPDPYKILTIFDGIYYVIWH